MSKQDKEHRRNVGEWLSQDVVWRIPVYQRHYAWGDFNTESDPIDLFWKTIKDQTNGRLSGKITHPHYLGAVLVENKTDKQAPNGRRYYDVVDGQQRLTTIQIALLALIRAMDDKNWGDENWRLNIKEEIKKYVFCEKGETKIIPRLCPTNFDHRQFKGILFDAYDIVADMGAENLSRENSRRSKILSNYEFFQKKFDQLVDENSLRKQEVVDAIMKTLIEGFDVVLIILREEDEAQLIFESLNNSAKPLTTFDLIRNNVFYRADLLEKGKDVELFSTDEWQGIESPYWGEKADRVNTHIEAYVARMLVAKVKKEILFNRNSIFNIYKEFSGDSEKPKFSSIYEEIKSLVSYEGIYRSLDKDTDESYFGVFYHKRWKNRDFYPVIFSIQGSTVSDEEKRKMLHILESFVIRRSVCRLSTDYYNQHAAFICHKLGESGSEPTYAALATILKNVKTDSALFPDDDKVKGDSVNKKFYNSLFQRYMFGKIEKSMHEDNMAEVELNEDVLTIDHILPQKWDTNEKWKIALKNTLLVDSSRNEADTLRDIKLIADERVDTIGNLTLMSGAKNAKKSNRFFDEFKKMFKESPIKMNRELAKETEWNTKKIEARSKELADIICKLWPYDIK